MGILTEDMQRVVTEQQLAFHATVCEDGTPNLSPKGVTRVLDDDHLFFADIRSPRTVANVRRGSQVEVNVVDQFVRKGYRFKGPATVHERGDTRYEEAVARLRTEGMGAELLDRIRTIVVIEVKRAIPLVSPAYDDGTVSGEGQVVVRVRRCAELHPQRVR